MGHQVADRHHQTGPSTRPIAVSSSDDGSTYPKLSGDGDFASQATRPRNKTPFRAQGGVPPPSVSVRDRLWGRLAGRRFTYAAPRNK